MTFYQEVLLFQEIYLAFMFGEESHIFTALINENVQ